MNLLCDHFSHRRFKEPAALCCLAQLEARSPPPPIGIGASVPPARCQERALELPCQSAKMEQRQGRKRRRAGGGAGSAKPEPGPDAAGRGGSEREAAARAALTAAGTAPPWPALAAFGGRLCPGPGAPTITSAARWRKFLSLHCPSRGRRFGGGRGADSGPKADGRRRPAAHVPRD